MTMTVAVPLHCPFFWRGGGGRGEGRVAPKVESGSGRAKADMEQSISLSVTQESVASSSLSLSSYWAGGAFFISKEARTALYIEMYVHVHSTVQDVPETTNMYYTLDLLMLCQKKYIKFD